MTVRAQTLIFIVFAILTSLPAVAADNALEEIIVTAQRRVESLQDAAIAIDAFGGDQLTARGISSATDLANIVPALTITDGGGINGQLYMRGVGNKANNDYLDPAITINYDGVPMARGSATGTGSFFDLERVEVLKGPQGTLYGKNATGGVLNIIPAKPQIGENNGYVTAGLGSDSYRQFEGAVNFAVGENNAVRIAGSWNERDGFNRDGTDDLDRWAMRAQWLSNVNDNLSIRIAGDYAEVGGVGSGTTPVGNYVRNGPPVPGLGLGNFSLVPSGLDDSEGMDTPAGNAYRRTILAAPGFGFLTSIQDDWFVDATLSGINAEINYETGFGTFTLIPAWRDTKQESLFNGPGFNSGWFNSEAEQTSVELRLGGSTAQGLADYVVGAYYFTEDTKGNNTFNQEFVLPLQDYTHEADSWAVFTQLTWNLTDRHRLVTGARYTDDRKEITGVINNYITFCGGLPPNNVAPPASFARGCAAPGNLPRFPTFDTVAQADAYLAAFGVKGFIPIPPGFLIPLSNGVGTVLHAVNANQDTLSATEPTYRLAFEWDAGEDSMLYVSFETGYRSGGLEPQEGDAYKPEFIDAYTFGSKNRFLEGRLQLNAEVFYWDYTDQQISYFNLNDNGVLQNDTQNVGKSTNKGADLDVQWLVGPNTLLSAKVQYLDASYKELHFLTSVPRDTINCPFTITGTNPDGSLALDFDCSGSQSIYSPEWTLQLGIQHTFDLGWANLTGSLYSQWVDDQQTGFNNLEHEFIDAHTQTDLDLTLASLNDTWSVSAYVRNLEDERRVASTQTPLLGMAMTHFGPPMTYGVRFSYNF